MPDVPAEAITAAEAAIRDAFPGEFGKPGMPEPDALARAALEAAAPLLAEACAQRILAHAERQHPRDPDHVPTAWHRHMDIAARVAAGAFYTREDLLRLAAQAIERGDVAWCNPPEVPGAEPR